MEKKNSNEKNTGAFDDLLTQIGEFGRFQYRLYFLLCLPCMLCALHTLAWVFVGGQADHRCLLPHEHPHNATFHLDDVNMSLPWSAVHGAWSRCERLNVNFSDDSYFASKIPSSETVPCEQFVFDTSVYSSTAINEFGLVCESGWKRSLVDTLLMFGNLCGSFIFGTASDRLGRKPTLFFALILQVSAGILASLAPCFESFIAFRFIIGTTVPGVFIVAYVLGIELVGASKRQYAGVMMQIFFSLGYMLTAVYAYLISDWRHLQLALSVPGLIFLVYWWIIPESPRWLIGEERIAEASIILQKVAKENNSELSSELVDKTVNAVGDYVQREKQGRDTPSLFQIFKYPNLRRNMFIVLYVWFVNNMSYFGITWNMSNLGGDPYVNFVISGAVELPGYVFVMVGINSWGRQPVLSTAILVAASSLLLSAIVAQSVPWLQLTLAMLGKMAVTTSCGCTYILSAEIFPTCVRNAVIGAAATMASFGAMIAPFIILLTPLWLQLPFFTLGCVTLISGLLTLMLPETLNQDLPDTIEEGEQFCSSKSDLKKGHS